MVEEKLFLTTSDGVSWINNFFKLLCLLNAEQGKHKNNLEVNYVLYRLSGFRSVGGESPYQGKYPGSSPRPRPFSLR